jgi:hypothetical protein
VALKTHYSGCLGWGEFFAIAKDNVLQFAWRDAQVVLFMTTVYNGQDKVLRARKRPQNTQAHITQLWGDAPIRDLEVPKAIDDYNHYMGSVDQADQARSYYTRNTRQYRTWKPLFMFLFQTSLSNAAKLWIDERARRLGEPTSKKKNQTLEFRIQVARRLLAGTKAAPRGLRGVQSDGSTTALNTGQNTCSGPTSMGWKDAKICTSCQSSGRRILKRKFGEISSSELNSRQGSSQESQSSQGSQSRPKRTRYGCSTCRVAICNDSICWQDHMAAKTM